MVLKPKLPFGNTALQFENDVKMYGTQTQPFRLQAVHKFENDVKMYGTQTSVDFLASISEFENDVKMYGTQTDGS